PLPKRMTFIFAIHNRFSNSSIVLQHCNFDVGKKRRSLLLVDDIATATMEKQHFAKKHRCLAKVLAWQEKHGIHELPYQEGLEASRMVLPSPPLQALPSLHL
ncbi:hypothetical protein L7F22_022880, partial [Adiantum nelumboides]|nr:hypothetical protein [Adiantum nelumboides]